jgi:8-oxo-dGTP pyrophosphatase MutT (NUDIX family)
LPGGRVDPGENLTRAAIRETREEAGVDVELCGVLSLQYTPRRSHVRLRVIFLGRLSEQAGAVYVVVVVVVVV